jgi:hypothetical protein
MQTPGSLAMRRGGVRQQVSDRVAFRQGGRTVHEGWALNVSRGGLRAILDVDEGAKVELGEEYEVVVGDPAEGGPDSTRAPRRGRIVWLQEEPDGFVVGVEYFPSGTHATVDAAPGEKPKGD